MNLAELKQAGFNDQEISQYVAEQTRVLKGAGFSDEEINAHFGTPKPESAPAADYDYEGYKQKYGEPPKGQHLTDEFKLPNHITFSTDSKYHNEKTPGGRWEKLEGKWHYTPSDFVLSQHPAEELKNYFKEKEKEAVLHLPEKISTRTEEPGLLERIVRPGPMGPKERARAANALAIAETTKQEPPFKWYPLSRAIGEKVTYPAVERVDFEEVGRQTGVSPSFIEKNYDQITKELGIRGVPTTRELIQSMMDWMIAGGAAKAPLRVATGLAGYMGAKEGESLLTQALKRERPKLFEGRELKELAGPVREPIGTALEAAEFFGPAGVAGTAERRIAGGLRNYANRGTGGNILEPTAEVRTKMPGGYPMTPSETMRTLVPEGPKALPEPKPGDFTHRPKMIVRTPSGETYEVGAGPRDPSFTAGKPQKPEVFGNLAEYQKKMMERKKADIALSKPEEARTVQDKVDIEAPRVTAQIEEMKANEPEPTPLPTEVTKIGEEPKPERLQKLVEDLSGEKKETPPLAGKPPSAAPPSATIPTPPPEGAPVVPRETVAEAPKAKEPWEMTNKEFEESSRAKLPEGHWSKNPTRREEQESSWKPLVVIAHKQHIQKAMAEGKPVPIEVLKEYPELAPTPTPARADIVAPAKAGEAPKSTFRQFVESKGEKWPIKTTDPKYQSLKAEFDAQGEKGPVSPSLVRKKEQLENKLSKLDAKITSSEKTDMPGTYVTGGSGVPALRIRKVEKQLDTRIERAKEVIEATNELKRVEAQIAYQENASVREKTKEQVADYSRKQFESIEVGDSVDIGGNAPLKVIKKNEKSVITEGGSKWNENEIGRVIKAKKPKESEPPKVQQETPIKDMTIDQLRVESDKWGKIEQDRFDEMNKKDPFRAPQIRAAEGFLNEEELIRRSNVNDELQRRTSISQEEAKRRVEEKRKARVEEEKGKKESASEEGLASERGSFSLKPIPKKEYKISDPDLGKLNDALDSVTSEKTPLRERLNVSQKANDSITKSKDTLHQSFGKAKAVASALWDAYRKPYHVEDFDRAAGELNLALTESTLNIRKFVKTIEEKIPNKTRREAIVNYIQADGDEGLLRQRADTAKGNVNMAQYARGYDEATKLTSAEKEFAESVRKYFDTRLEQAKTAGLLDEGIENYVNQIWDRDPDFGRKIAAEHQAGILKSNPSFIKQRVIDDYFSGEQIGLKPRNKDIGYLISVYDKSFNQALATRKFVRDLFELKAKDGRPYVVTEGVGTKVEGAQEAEAYIVKPYAHPKAKVRGLGEEEGISLDTGDYREIVHPVFKKWKWIQNDEAGKPIMMEGRALVHPEAYDYLNNFLKPSAIRKNVYGRTVLKGIAMGKGTLLSLSGFHQVQEGVHAIFHKVDPTRVPEISLDPKTDKGVKTRKLVSNGLTIADPRGHNLFMEGNYSSSLTERLPGVGPLLSKYGRYLFEDYIPRLKTKMALDALERNTKRYSKDLTGDDIYKLTAQQANAAFGELDYIMPKKKIGEDGYTLRSKTTQDILRLMLLAPDFLEARGRFAAQALAPYGREQFMAAVVRGTLGMYFGAAAVNYMMSGDPHWEHPFSVVVGDKRYALRSVPGDVLHLISDPRSFVYYRLNPSIVTPAIEALTKRDAYGYYRDFSEQIADYFSRHTPIPLQGLTSNQKKLWESALGSIGVGGMKLHTAFEREVTNIARQRNVYTAPEENRDRMKLLRKFVDRIRTSQEEGGKDDDEITKDLGEALKERKLRESDIAKIDKYLERGTPLEQAFRVLTPREAINLWPLASQEERRMLSPILERKLDKFMEEDPEAFEKMIPQIKSKVMELQ